jgi:hypothetical protein
MGKCVEQLTSLLGFLKGRTAQMYTALLRKFQVENLKVLLRSVRAGEPEGTEGWLVELPARLSLPRRQLLDCSETSEFVDALAGTPYHAAALSAVDLARESQEGAYLEMAFDRAYLAALTRFSSIDAVRCELLGAQVLCVLRGADLYALPWEHLRTFLPSAENDVLLMLSEIYSDPAIEHVLPLVQERVGELQSKRKIEDIPALEEAFWARTVHLARRAYYGEMRGWSALVGYYYLKRDEMRKLLTLTELVRCGRGRRERVEALDLEGATAGS